jgi:Archaeal fructose-1,6-bisphosphatase and related enzymes of inositol monophosphatase family
MPAFAPPYADDLELLRSTAVAAGIIASSYFRKDVRSWTKENASPVSEADIIVDRFLAANLLQARPDYGWLSEETADNPSRLDCERVFVVDPIDGTRAFLRGEDYWTVSLAVVENGVPVAGVVYAPAAPRVPGRLPAFRWCPCCIRETAPRHEVSCQKW